MITTLLFDFDGTIADTLPTSADIIRSLSAKYGYKPLSNKESEYMRDFTIQEIFKESHVAFYKLPLMVYDVKKELNKHIGGLTVIKGMKAVLEILRKQYHLAIITSNDKTNVEIFLKNNHVDFFDSIYTGTTIFGKARLIQGFLKKNNLQTKEVVYVGDEIRDIEATKKVGVPIIAATWGFNSRKGLARFEPDYIIDSPREILPILKNL